MTSLPGLALHSTAEIKDIKCNKNNLESFLVKRYSNCLPLALVSSNHLMTFLASLDRPHLRIANTMKMRIWRHLQEKLDIITELGHGNDFI